MATYNVLYVSTAIPGDLDQPIRLPNVYSIGGVNSGTSSGISTTTQDLIELSLVTGATYQITKRDVLNALEVFRKWILETSPQTAGASDTLADETGYGLDGLIQYLIEDGNTVAAIP